MLTSDDTKTVVLNQITQHLHSVFPLTVNKKVGRNK